MLVYLGFHWELKSYRWVSMAMETEKNVPVGLRRAADSDPDWPIGQS